MERAPKDWVRGAAALVGYEVVELQGRRAVDAITDYADAIGYSRGTTILTYLILVLYMNTYDLCGRERGLSRKISLDCD